LLFAPNDTFIVLVVVIRRRCARGCCSATLARTADARRGVQARGRALLGVRVGRMFTSAGRWPRSPARSPACSSRRRCSSRPNNFDPILISGFVAAVLGGLDSPPGAVIGA
jgi:branched-chain amino acid transport system permease protein